MLRRVLPILFLAALPGVASAVPVTVEFEATIDEITDLLGSAGVPLSVAEGDQLSGRFTFEPAPGAPERQTHPQSMGLELELGELALQVDEFAISASNGAFLVSALGTYVRIGPADRYLVLCDGSCGPVPGHPSVDWGASISFRDADGFALDDARLSGDIATWRSFSSASATILLGAPAGTFVSATLDPIRLVPEPSTAALLVTAAAVLLRTAGRRRSTRSPT